MHLPDESYNGEEFVGGVNDEDEENIPPLEEANLDDEDDVDIEFVDVDDDDIDILPPLNISVDGVVGDGDNMDGLGADT